MDCKLQHQNQNVYEGLVLYCKIQYEMILSDALFTISLLINFIGLFSGLGGTRKRAVLYCKIQHQNQNVFGGHRAVRTARWARTDGEKEFVEVAPFFFNGPVSTDPRRARERVRQTRVRIRTSEDESRNHGAPYSLLRGAIQFQRKYKLFSMFWGRVPSAASGFELNFCFWVIFTRLAYVF